MLVQLFFLENNVLSAVQISTPPLAGLDIWTYWYVGLSKYRASKLPVPVTWFRELGELCSGQLYLKKVRSVAVHKYTFVVPSQDFLCVPASYIKSRMKFPTKYFYVPLVTLFLWLGMLQHFWSILMLNMFVACSSQRSLHTCCAARLCLWFSWFTDFARGSLCFDTLQSSQSSRMASWFTTHF